MATERIGRAVLEIATDQRGFMADVAALKNEAQTNIPNAFKKAKAAVDDLAAGMGKAGTDALASGKLIAGMSTIGRDELAKLAQGSAPAIGTFDKLKSVIGQINPLLAAMGVTMSVGAIAGFAKEVGSFAGEIIDLNAQWQIGTTRLQAFNYAGVGAGLTLQGLSSSADQLQKRIGEGDASVVGALSGLNLGIDELRQLKLDEVMFRIDDALVNVGNQFERATILTDLFGRSGAQMGRLLDGSLREVIKVAEESGAIIDEELLKKADAFDDAWAQGWIKFRAMATDAIGFVGGLLDGLRHSAQVGFSLENFGVLPGPKPGGMVFDVGSVQRDIELLHGKRGASDPSIVFGGGIGSVIDESPVEKAMREWRTKTAAAYRSLQNAIGEELLKLEGQFLAMSSSSATLRLQALAMRSTPGVLPNLNAGLTSLAMFGPGAMRDRRGMTISDSLGTAMKEFSLSGFLRNNLGSTVMSAITGGGNVGESIGGLLGQGLTTKLMSGGIGKAISGGLTSVLGSTVGGALNAVLPGAGALLGPLIGKGLSGLGKLFGIGKEGAKTNDLRDAKLMEFTGADSLRGAQDTFRRMAADAGLTDAEIRKVFDTRRVNDFERAADSAFNKIRQFQSDQEADQARLTAAIERYGFAFEQLGPKFQKQKLDEQARELIEDWRVLVGSGIDLGLVNDKMSESINEYLQTALRVGAEVPGAMRPILQKMLEQGVLTDEAGNAITDLEGAGIHFAETMTQGFDRVVDRLNELIKRLGLAGEAIASFPTVPTGIVDPSSMSPADLGTVPALAVGGIAVRPLLGLIGEGGPEAVIPLDRLGDVIGSREREGLVEGKLDDVVSAIGALHREFRLMPSQLLAAALARV